MIVASTGTTCKATVIFVEAFKDQHEPHSPIKVAAQKVVELVVAKIVERKQTATGPRKLAAADFCQSKKLMACCSEEIDCFRRPDERNGQETKPKSTLSTGIKNATKRPLDYQDRDNTNRQTQTNRFFYTKRQIASLLLIFLLYNALTR